MPHTLMLWLLGAAAAQEPPAPCPDVDLDVAADDAVRALTDDELAYARDVATAALAGVGCVTRVVDPEDLATLYQVRAGAGFYADPPLAFIDDLKASAVALPGWFNDRLGPELRRAWEDAAAGIGGSAALRVGPIPDDGVLYVDGQSREGPEVAVAPGPHLVQVAVGAEVAWAWAGPLADGDALSLETALPEPTRARVVRDNPLLFGGLAAGVAVGGGLIGTASYGQRFVLQEDGHTFYDDDPSDGDAWPDPVVAVDGHWRLYRTMEAGLAVGSVTATALLTAHVVRKLQQRRSR